MKPLYHVSSILLMMQKWGNLDLRSGSYLLEWTQVLTSLNHNFSITINIIQVHITLIKVNLYNGKDISIFFIIFIIFYSLFFFFFHSLLLKICPYLRKVRLYITELFLQLLIFEKIYLPIIGIQWYQLFGISFFVIEEIEIGIFNVKSIKVLFRLSPKPVVIFNQESG